MSTKVEIVYDVCVCVCERDDDDDDDGRMNGCCWAVDLRMSDDKVR